MIDQDTYVYIANLANHPDCYKVGSSINPMARLYQLDSPDYDYFKIVLMGKSNSMSSLELERKIQHSIHKFCNRHYIWYGNDLSKCDKIVGSAKSKEFFILNEDGLNIALKTLAINCYELYGERYSKFKDEDVTKIKSLLKGWGDA